MGFCPIFVGRRPIFVVFQERMPGRDPIILVFRPAVALPYPILIVP